MEIWGCIKIQSKIMTGLMEAALTRVICKQARLKQHLSCPIQLMHPPTFQLNRLCGGLWYSTRTICVIDLAALGRTRGHGPWTEKHQSTESQHVNPFIQLYNQPSPLYPSLYIQYSIRSCLHTRQTTKSIHLLKSEMYPLPLHPLPQKYSLCRPIHFKTYDRLTSIQLA